MAAVLPSHRDRRVGRQLKLAQREDALRRDIRLIEWTFDPLETRNAHFNINRLGAISRRYIPNFYGITSSPLHRSLPTDRLLAEWHLESKRVIAAINDLTPDPRECPAHVHIDSPETQPQWTPGQSSSKSSPQLPKAADVSATAADSSALRRGTINRAPAGELAAAGLPSGLTPDSSPRADESATPAASAAAPAPSETPSVSELIEMQSRLRAALTEWFSKGYAMMGVRFTRSGVDYCLGPYSDF